MKFKVQFNMLESQTPLQTKVAINFPYEELELKHSLAERQGNMCVSPPFFSHPQKKKRLVGRKFRMQRKLPVEPAENRGNKVKLHHRKLRNNNKKTTNMNEDVSLINNGDVPLSCLFSGRGVKF